jgi:hypothetical protein
VELVWFLPSPLRSFSITVARRLRLDLVTFCRDVSCRHLLLLPTRCRISVEVGQTRMVEIGMPTEVDPTRTAGISIPAEADLTRTVEIVIPTTGETKAVVDQEPRTLALDKTSKGIAMHRAATTS